jgi:hypothetical protein
LELPLERGVELPLELREELPLERRRVVTLMMTPFGALPTDLGSEEALGSREPFVGERGERDRTPAMIVFNRDVAFVSGFDNFGPGGLRKRNRIKRVADGARDGGEEVVVDAMVLVRDESSSEVKHATHGGRVLLGDTDVKPAASTGFPLWDFLAVLEHRVEDVDRTAPDVGSLEVVVVGKFHTGEELDGRHAGATFGHIVPEVDGMFKGHRPEVKASLAWPVDDRMEHHGASP